MGLLIDGGSAGAEQAFGQTTGAGEKLDEAGAQDDK
jgi:hypothetical protein